MNDLTIIQASDTAVPQVNSIGAAANEAAARAAFADYLSRKSNNTIRNQAAALSSFAEFLALLGHATPNDLQYDPVAWQGVTWGLVEAFAKWLLREGYSVATVNNRLSAVKGYARLAAKAGTLPGTELALIRTVSGYGRTEAKRVNERRPVQRVGDKKPESVKLTHGQAQRLKQQPETPTGQRDRLMLCLLLDHGLRVSEVAGLRVGDFNQASGTLTFYRPKVDLTQTHELSADTLAALSLYLLVRPFVDHDMLLVGSYKGHGLSRQPMGIRAMNDRVGWLGRKLDIDQLSPHDCRHWWATYWASRVDVLRLQEAGGWASLAMPRRYVEAAAVANEGMVNR